MFSGSVYQPVISDRDNTEMFLIHSATVTMYNVSDGDREGIFIDDTTGQQLRAMGVSVEGKCARVHAKPAINASVFNPRLGSPEVG